MRDFLSENKENIYEYISRKNANDARNDILHSVL